MSCDSPMLDHSPMSEELSISPSRITKYILAVYRGAEQRPEEASDLLTQSLTRGNADELWTSRAAASNDEYEVVQRAVRIDLDECVSQPRGPPLTLERWSQGMDADGRITDPQSIKKLIFRGVSTISRVENTFRTADRMELGKTTESESLTLAPSSGSGPNCRPSPCRRAVSSGSCR